MLVSATTSLPVGHRIMGFIAYLNYIRGYVAQN